MCQDIGDIDEWGSPVDKGRFLIERHLKEGTPIAELAAANGMHRSWLYKLLARYEAEGESGLVPRSKRPHRSPSRVADLFEDEIVRLRKSLEDAGWDAGPETIHEHLTQRHRQVPSVSTIWRVLRARGFITPQPHKRPRGSYVRFVAELPNECWQMDTTHVRLADGSDVEILNVIDDHSRLCVGARTRRVYQAAGWWRCSPTRSIGSAPRRPSSRTTGPSSPPPTASVSEPWSPSSASLGVDFKHSRPYHPQTCGKVERFHQTMKKYLRRQAAPGSLRTLQAQIDRFVEYYNTTRPHRSLGRRTPAEVFFSRAKAHPRLPSAPGGHRLRHDRVDPGGKLTLRHNGRLHHIGVGRAHAGEVVAIFVSGRDVRIVSEEGELIREFELDPSRDYQPMN